jgi:DNA polymerase-4
MPEQTIAHVDMDAFYAAVEIRDNPSLAGLPVVVGGSSRSRGVVAAASYVARRYGIHSAMPMARAEKLCPELIRVPPSFGKYHDVSRQVMAILGEFSPVVEPLSLDEAFLDLTGTEGILGAPPDLGRRIKSRIREETRLTASVGIAPVKFVAKIASDLEKPDGLVVVEPGRVEEFLRPLPIHRLWGVGPRTRESLEGLGIRTIGDLAAFDPAALTARFGLHGEHLIALARGEDERGVVPDEEAKSYSHEETFARDHTDREMLEGVLLDQSIRVARRLRDDGVAGRIVQLKLRYHDFHTITRRGTLAERTSDADRIFEAARSLFREAWNGEPIRLIGAGVSGVRPEGTENLDLFRPPEVEGKQRRLAETIDRLEDRYGHGKVTRARLVGETRERLISEPITPLAGSFDAAAMSQGEPGPPAGFVWHDREYRVLSRGRTWKVARPEPGGELYVRRHYFLLEMDDGSRWTVYCLRKVSPARRSGPPAPRWFLYSIA